jgi:RND family efflux transporter MFP subunit
MSTPLRNSFRRFRFRAATAAGLAVLAAGLATWTACSKRSAAETSNGKSPAAESAVAVSAAPVMLRKDVKRTIDVVGNFQGLEEVMVTPKVSGLAVKINCDVQDIVHTGDVLLEIDKTDYELAVREAQRARDTELAKLGLRELPAEGTDVRKLLESLPTGERARAAVQQAQARQKRARLDYNRAVPLLPSRAISQEDFDRISAERDEAEAAVKQAEAALGQAELDAGATLATALLKDATLATARQKLADTTVKVPASKIEGKAEFAVAERMIELGEMVMASPIFAKGVVRLVNDRTLKVIAMVPERYVRQIRTGLDVEVTTEAHPGKVFPGKLVRINPTVDRTSRTFQVEVHVDNHQRPLKAGGFAKLAIVTERASQALTVPGEAIATYAGVNKVFVMRNGKAHVVPVTPGTEGATPQGRWVEVVPEKAGDLEAGQQVITRGYVNLTEGTAVEVQKDGT